MENLQDVNSRRQKMQRCLFTTFSILAFNRLVKAENKDFNLKNDSSVL